MIDHGGDQLGSSARALLDAAREGLGPDAAAIGRVRAKVGAQVGAGAATGLALKLGLVGIALAVAVGVGLYATRDHAALSASETPAIDLPSARSEASPPVVRPGAAAEGMPVIEMAPQSAVRARPVLRADAPVAAGITLTREVELIDLAMAALRRGDAGAALVAIHTHARETRGAGQLAEDAAAIEVEALCRLHDPAVASKLEAFDTQFPRSAQRSRLTTVCK
ncbi:MAG: hypothetical protein IPQ07_35750 [Myxococcales bacterium]|nr:hypothetical protein [Myxococcales bacterium]